MKVIVALVLLAIVVQGSFIAEKLQRREIVRDGLQKFNSQDFITGVLLALRFVEKVPDAYVCSANVDEVNKAVATAKGLVHQGGVDNVVKAV